MKKLLPLILLVPLLLFSCLKTENKRPLIVCSIPVWESVAKYIAGSDFNYYSIIKSGESPHGYELKPMDAEKLKKANLVIIHGLGLDDWAVRGVKPKKLLNIGKLFEKKYPFIKKPGYHIWMNPVLMEDVYFEVAVKLTEFYPNRETYYNKRAEDYAAMIDQMIRRIYNCLGNSKKEAIVIYHPVWKPLLETFGFKVIEIARTPEEKITPQRIKEVISLAKREKAKLVIGEVFADKKTPEFIAKEIGAKVLIMNPLPSEDYVIALSNWGEKICKALKEKK